MGHFGSFSLCRRSGEKGRERTPRVPSGDPRKVFSLGGGGREGRGGGEVQGFGRRHRGPQKGVPEGMSGPVSGPGPRVNGERERGGEEGREG